MDPSPYAVALPQRSGPRRAVVIGASIGGLLAAAALQGHVDEIVLVDRDDLTDSAQARGGVPQGRHSHAVLAAGRTALEDLLPGLTAELLALGARTGDVQQVTEVYVGPRPLAKGTSGMQGLAVSRPALERAVRRRVMGAPGVSVLDRTSVLDIALTDGRATGLQIESHDRVEGRRILAADLVIDASGRTSRMPEWLLRNGFEAPVEEQVRVDVGYATRRFRRRPGTGGGAVAIVVPASEAVPRGGVLIAQERGEWTVSLAGYHCDRPPTDWPAFTAYARTLVSPAIADALAGLEPIDDGAVYRFPANRRRRYERVDRFPEGLLVTADAICAFDPVFGQGMTVAALEAVDLRRCLARSDAGTRQDEGRDLAPAFFAAAARIVDNPWSVTSDSVPAAGVPSAPLPTRLVRAYVRALQRAAADDPAVALALLRVMHMVEGPRSLTHLSCAARVARSAVRHPRRPSRARGHLPPAPAQLPDAAVRGSHHPRTNHETGQRS